MKNCILALGLVLTLPISADANMNRSNEIKREKFAQCSSVHIWAASWNTGSLRDNLTYAGEQWAHALTEAMGGDQLSASEEISRKLSMWQTAMGIDGDHPEFSRYLQAHRPWVYDHFQRWFQDCKIISEQYSISYQPFDQETN